MQLLLLDLRTIQHPSVLQLGTFLNLSRVPKIPVGEITSIMTILSAAGRTQRTQRKLQRHCALLTLSWGSQWAASLGRLTGTSPVLALGWCSRTYVLSHRPQKPQMSRYAAEWTAAKALGAGRAAMKCMASVLIVQHPQGHQSLRRWWHWATTGRWPTASRWRSAMRKVAGLRWRTAGTASELVA